MKRTVALLSLLLIIPLKSWATFPAVVVGDMKLPVQIATLGKGAASLVAQGNVIALLTYANIIASQNYYQNSAPIGAAFATLPGHYTTAGTMVKMYNEARANTEEMAIMRDKFTKPGKYIDMSPRELQKTAAKVMSGDWKSMVIDAAQRKFRQAKEQLVEQFSMQRLAEMATQFTEDVLACRTPQIDAVFPSFNLDTDLGLLMCDYKEMFSDMKDQVNTITDRDWGETFTINGRKASDVIKDGDLLKDAIQRVPPTMGRKLAIDALANQSIDASVQASVDMTSLIREMETIAKNRKNSASDITIPDLLTDLINVNIKATQANMANANATNRIQASKNQIDAIKESNSTQRDFRENFDRTQTQLIIEVYPSR